MTRATIAGGAFATVFVLLAVWAHGSAAVAQGHGGLSLPEQPSDEAIAAFVDSYISRAVAERGIPGAAVPSSVRSRVRIHAYGLTESHSEAVAALLQRVALVEMVPAVLARTLEPFPRPVRTLDALHLSSAEFVRSQGEEVAIASYDDRFVAAARDLEFSIAEV